MAHHRRWPASHRLAGPALLAGWLCLSSCGALRLERALDDTVHDWPMSGGGSDRTASIENADLAPPLDRVWAHKADAAFGAGSAVIRDGVVFIGTLKGEVEAIRLADGSGLGKREFGDAVVGAPVVDYRTVYIANAWGRDVLTAHDLLTGRSRWERRGVPIEAGLLLVDGTLFAADIEGSLHAVDAASGETRWKRETDPTLGYFAAPVAVGDLVIAADDKGTVRAYEMQTGDLRWDRALGDPVYSSLTVTGEYILVPSTRGTFTALEARSGTLVWQYRVDDATVRMSPAAASPTRIVFGGSDGFLRAVEPFSGSEVWRVESDGNFAAGPVISGPVVYAASLDRMLYAVDLAAGTVLWSRELDGRVKSALAVSDDTLVILAEPRHVYGFRRSSEGNDVSTPQ